jgi:hypothetical protein
MRRGGGDLIGEPREGTRVSSGWEHAEGEIGPKYVEEKAPARLFGFALEAGTQFNVIMDHRMEPRTLTIIDIKERANRGRGRWIGVRLGG